MELIYRGETISYTPAPQVYRQAQAINWRYQLSGKSYTLPERSIAVSYRKPEAINWRYQ